MSDDEVCRVLDVIRHDARCPSVSFTGGEPTLRPALAALRAPREGASACKVNLISNGQRLDARRAGELADAGLDSAQLSLEGADAPGCTTRSSAARVPSTGSGAGSSSCARAACACTRTRTRDPPQRRRGSRRSWTSWPSAALERLTMNLVIPCGTAGGDASLHVRVLRGRRRSCCALRARAAGARRAAHLVLAAAAVPVQHRGARASATAAARRPTACCT